MRYEHGRILAINEVTLGSELVSAHAAGVTSLTVADPVDFDVDGGTLLINGQVIGYTSCDDETGEITLVDPLAAAAEEGDRVDAYDPLYNIPTTDRVAQVILDGDDANTDALEATIAHALIAYLPEGIRTGQGEAVLLEWDGDDLRIADLLGQTEGFDGGTIPPETLPVEPKSDGQPPAYSPDPTVEGGIGTLFVTWDNVPNLDPVTYDVYVSTSSTFTPGAGTFVGSVAGTLFVVRTLADGTPLNTFQWYWVKLIARDVDGSAPASITASGYPIQITRTEITDDAISTPQLAANAVTAGKILANEIKAWHFESVLSISNRFVSGDPNGARVEMNAGGIEAWGLGGVKTLDIDSATGAVAVTGTLTTSASGKRVSIYNTSTYGMIEFAGMGSLSSGLIFADVSGSLGELYLTPPNTGDNRPMIRMFADSTIKRVDMISPDGVKFATSSFSGGRPLKLLDFGNETVTTDADGKATISHSLGTTPAAVFVIGDSQETIANMWQVTSRASGSFTIRIRDDAGAPLASASRRVSWLALA